MQCIKCGNTLEAGAAVCGQCGSPVPASLVPPLNPAMPTGQVGGSSGISGLSDANIMYYGVAPAKLFILSVTTFGIFELYWFAKNWTAFKAATGRKLSPFARAVFTVFYCYSLFSKVLHSAQLRGYASSYTAAALAAAYIGFAITNQLPDPWWLLFFFGSLPLLPIQQAINYNNSRVDPSFQVSSKFSVGEILLAIVGGILVVVSVISAFAPALPTV